MTRSHLPFRKNCEGYFLSNCGRALVRDTGKGYLVFPGGGVDEDEDIKVAVQRETFEETGARVDNIKKVAVVRFIWDENWAKNDKQKKRYEEFQGEEMHLFVGKIQGFEEVDNPEEDYWQGEKLMEIDDAIELIKNEHPFRESMKEYRECQIKFLKELREE